MNVLSMCCEILGVANAMIGKSALPDCAAAKLLPESVGVSAFDQLQHPFQGHVARGCKQKMNVLGHHHESMQLKVSLATIAVERLEK